MLLHGSFLASIWFASFLVTSERVDPVSCWPLHLILLCPEDASVINVNGSNDATQY